MSVRKGIIIAASLLIAIIIAIVVGWFVQRPASQDRSPDPLSPEDVSDIELLPAIDAKMIENLFSEGMLEVIRGENGRFLHVDGEFTAANVSSEADAASVLNAASGLFGGGFKVDPSDLSMQNIGEGTSYGRSFYRYNPSVNGVPVLGSEVILNTNGDGVVQGISSSYDDRINDVNTNPVITPARAGETALRFYLSSYEVSDRLNTVADLYGFEPVELEAMFISVLATDAELYIHAADSSMHPALVWAVVIETMQNNPADTDISLFPYISVTYYIYANGPNAGQILSVSSNIRDLTHISITAADMNGRNRTINAVQNGDKYKLHDSVRNIETYDAEPTNLFDFWGAVGSAALPGYLISVVPGGTPGGSSVSAHANIAAVYDYYKEILGRTSFDGRGGKIVTSIGYRNHADDDYDNAGWLTPMSGYHQFVFGYDIDLERALDAVGHEYTHAVINYVVGNGRMITLGGGSYRESQAGALNEAYADIMGSLIEDKPGNERWIMYEDSSQGFVRSMSTMRHMSDWRVQRSAGSADKWDYCCHYNSGIFSHAAYLMMTDARTGSISYETWARVFYRSLYELPVNASFLHARGSILAAAEANHFSQSGKQAIRDAFDAVGIVDGFSIKSSFVDVTSQFINCTVALRSTHNGRYVSVKQDGTPVSLLVTSDVINATETFITEGSPGGYIAFKSSANGKYVTAIMSDPDTPVYADAESHQYSEQFKIYQYGSDYYILAPNNMWVSARADTPDVPLHAIYDHAMDWERFDIPVLFRQEPETRPETPPETRPETDTYSIATAVNNTNYGAAAANPATASQGTLVTVTATPRSGFEFERWEVVTDGVTLNNVNSATATLTMPGSNVLVRAHFIPLPTNNIAVSVNNSSSGTASANPATAARGVRVTLTASPRNGFEFERWEVVSGGVTLSSISTATATFTMPDNAVSVRAHFRDLPVNNNIITVSANNSDFGAASANRSSAALGTQITLTATSYDGYEFGHWEIISGGAVISNVNSATATFSMPGNAVSVRAHFNPSATAPRIQTSTLSNGTVGQVYNQTLQASGTTPVTWSVSTGSLPAGLSLNSGTGVISGTPTRAESSNFSIRAINSAGDDFRAFTVTINESTTSETVSAPHIPQQTLSGGTVNQAYSYTIQATGTAPLTWSLTSGVLPTGLSLNTSTGVISGTPIAPGSATLTVTATNSAGSDSRTFNLTVAAAGSRYNITVSVNNTSFGSAAADVQTAAQGTRINLTAAARSGYMFSGWEVVSGGVRLDDTYALATTFIMPGNDVSIRAHYEPAATEATRYRVIVSDTIIGTEGDWGTVSISNELAPAGVQISCIVNMRPGWEFIEWSVVSGGITIADRTSPRLAFMMPAHDVHLMIFVRNIIR